MSIKFVEPKPIKAELIQELDGLVGQLHNLSIRKPMTFHVQEAAMEARMSDYLELTEQSFIKGWTDCEEGIPCKEYQSDAYYNGFSECYRYENQGGE